MASVPTAAIPLAYEPPRSDTPRRAAGAIVVVTLFICAASAGIFSIEVDGHRYRSAGDADSWPAAVAVLGLALMGTSIAFFVTRRR